MATTRPWICPALSAACLTALVAALLLAGCGTSYKAQPLPFKAPTAYANTVTVAETVIGGQAFAAEGELEIDASHQIRLAF